VRVRPRGIVALLTAGALGAAAAALVASAGGPAATAGAATTPQTVTLGSTTGNPTANICVAGINCTYAPFNGVEAPGLEVPFDGTVTSFSVNSASSTNHVALRVLRPAGGGQFTGAGTSPSEPLGSGPTTFTVSIPVKAGDILGLDNSDSALMFDTTTPSAITAFYELPALADGATAAPNQARTGLRLLLSATVVQRTTTTTTGTSNTTTTTTTTTTAPPIITGLRQARRTWREGTRPATIAAAATGTVFTFDLGGDARVTVTFTGKASGRRVGGRCVSPTRKNRHSPSCTRTVPPARLSFAGHGGANALSFEGLVGRHLLPLGRYSATFTASNAHGQASPVALTFTIVG